MAADLLASLLTTSVLVDRALTLTIADPPVLADGRVRVRTRVEEVDLGEGGGMEVSDVVEQVGGRH